MAKEIWKAIDLNPAYEVSDRGRVRYFCHSYGLFRGQKPVFKIYYPCITVSQRGYARTAINMGGYQKSMTMHRLVALTFIPNPKQKPQVNHKNGVKTDNRLKNLEWMTAKENTRHAFRRYRKQPFILRGEATKAAKIKEGDVRFIRRMRAKGLWSSHQLANKFHLTRRAIDKIIARKSWAHVKK